MLAYFSSLFAQNTMTLIACGVGAAMVAHSFASFFSSWLYAAYLFPGLLVGSLAFVDLCQDQGLIVGRDTDNEILVAATFGLMLSLLVLMIVRDIVYWAVAIDRRGIEDVMNRNKPDR